MDILDDMGVSKLSAKVFFFKVNYSFNNSILYSFIDAYTFQKRKCFNFLKNVQIMSNIPMDPKQ